MVSVIIPVFNAENFIRRCIDSVLSQSYSDLELILIDDGSSDSSAVICHTYAEADPRVHYFYQDNSGPDMARKAGVLQSKGEFLCFIDSDDYIAESMIEDMLREMTMRNCDLACCNLMRFTEKKSWKLETNVNSPILLEGSKALSEAFFMDRSIPGGYPAKVFKRKLLENYQFVKDAVIGEDISGVLYALEQAERVILLPENYYFYYWHTGSISHGKYSERHLISLKNYISVRNYQLSRKLIPDKYIHGFFAEFEMAVATAMSRAKVYDSKAAELLRDDLRRASKSIYRNEVTPLYMKVCILLYLLSPKLFITVYRGVYLLTGR